MTLRTPTPRGRGMPLIGRGLPCPALVLCTAIAAGCGGSRAWAPVEPDAFERLSVESTGRWGSTTELRFGEYVADSVSISWARGGGDGVQLGGVGADHAQARQAYRFSLATAGGTRVPVVCASSMREQNVGVRMIEVRTSAHYTFDCDIRPAAGAAWHLSLTAGGDDGFSGALATERTRLTVHTRMGGNRVLGRRADAHELRNGENVVATVEPRGRVVWLSRGAPGEERAAAAATAIALLLYQRIAP